MILNLSSISQNNFLVQSLAYLTEKWELRDVRPLEPSAFTKNYVAVVFSKKHGVDVVLKICPEGIEHERSALVYFRGRGCVALIDYDIEAKALLLEYIQSGITLKTLFPDQDEMSVTIAAHVIKSYATPYTSSAELYKFPTIADWLVALQTCASPHIPKQQLRRAWDIAQRLLATQGMPYLLHGDLHHENILQRGDEWVAIDPKGVIGELAYDIGAFVRNPIPDLLNYYNARNIVMSRMADFGDLLSVEVERLVQWSFVQAVLSACWSGHDKASTSNCSYYLAYADLIATIM